MKILPFPLARDVLNSCNLAKWHQNDLAKKFNGNAIEENSLNQKLIPSAILEEKKGKEYYLFPVLEEMPKLLGQRQLKIYRKITT